LPGGARTHPLYVCEAGVGNLDCDGLARLFVEGKCRRFSPFTIYAPRHGLFDAAEYRGDFENLERRDHLAEDTRARFLFKREITRASLRAPARCSAWMPPISSSRVLTNV